MELDKRIKEGKRPLTCLDIEQAREFVGKECIFSDKYENFKNLDKYLFVYNSDYSAILSIDDYTRNGDYVFRNAKNGAHYGLILPLEWVKEPEKKYRPYTLAEWIDQHEIGEVIHCRNEHKQEFHVMYTGYVIDNGEDIQDTRTTGRIMLINIGYFVENLFKDYEICINGEWQPFGVIEDD